LSTAAREALSDPVIRERLENVGLSIPPAEQISPEGLSVLQKAEIAAWADPQGGKHQVRLGM
jgi:hypothetical protein